MMKHIILLGCLFVLFMVIVSYVLAGGETFVFTIPLVGRSIDFEFSSLLLSEILIMLFVFIAVTYSIHVSRSELYSYALDTEEVKYIAEKMAEMRVSYIRDQLKEIDHRTYRNMNEISRIKLEIDKLKKVMGLEE